MKQNFTEMVFVLDRSGSMQPLVDDTIGGFNSMVEKQKHTEGDVRVTTVLFDHEYELLHDRVNINDISLMTSREYFTRGNTALLDALGRTISTVGSRLDAMPEEERPDKVIFIITTDGLENASREFDKKTIKEMIRHQQDKYSWTFMFLGANMDAVSEAETLGIKTDFARTYTADRKGTALLWGALSDAVSCARSADFDVNDSESTCYRATMSALDEVNGGTGDSSGQKIVLTDMDCPQISFQIQLAQNQPVTIGRKDVSDVMIGHHSTVSARHCAIFMRGKRFFVMDLQSKNGTYLNGRRISGEEEIRPGDVLCLGDMRLLFQA